MIRITLCLLFLFTLNNASPAFDLDSLLVKSVGGPAAMDNLRRVIAYHNHGIAELNGLRGQFDEYFAIPNRYYLELDFPDYSMVQAYDGTTAWQRDHNGQVSEIAGYEKDEILKGLYLGSFSYLFDGRLEGNRKYVREDTIDGKTYHRVALYPLHKDTITAFYDTQTGLLVFSDSEVDNLPCRTYVDGHQEIGGILWPVRTKMVMQGAPLTIILEYQRVTLNPELDMSMFRMPGTAASDFYFPKGVESVRVPFDYRAGLIRLPVTVNGRKKAWLILDSGASANIFDESLAGDLALDVVGTLAAKGIGDYEEVHLVRTDSVSIGKLTLYNQVAGVLDMRQISTQGPDGLPFGGILGYDFLSRFPVLVDYRDSVLTVYDPDGFTPPRGGIMLDFHLSMKVPTIRAELNGIPGYFIIDLGNAFGLILHSRFTNDHGLLEALDNIGDTPRPLAGIGGMVSGKTAYAATFRFGDILLQSIRVMLPDSTRGLAGSEELAGNVGNKVLENFRVLFDYSASKITFYDADN